MSMTDKGRDEHREREIKRGRRREVGRVIVSISCLTYNDNGWCEQAPWEELEEDDDQGMVDTRLEHPTLLEHKTHIISIPATKYYKK